MAEIVPPRNLTLDEFRRLRPDMPLLYASGQGELFGKAIVFPLETPKTVDSTVMCLVIFVYHTSCNPAIRYNEIIVARADELLWPARVG